MAVNARMMRLVAVTMLVVVALMLQACTAVVPAAAPAGGAAAASDAGKWCKDVKITFFPGGPAGGVFANNVYNGAQQAEADLGPTVTYVFSDWDPQKMIQQFQEAVATSPDGIAVMGHPGDDAFSPLIDAAVSEGIIVTSQNTELPASFSKYQGNGFGYVGAVNYTAGYNLGKEAVKRFNLQSGERAMVWGLLSQPSRGERTQGVIDALEEAGMTVDYLEIDAATNKDPAAGAPTFAGYVSENPDVKVVVTDHGGLTATTETYLKAAGKGADDIIAIGFDLSPATLEAVRSGWTDLVIDQQPWLQGYLPILQICLTKTYGFSGLMVDSGAGFADKDNIEFLAPFVEKEIR
ncbi:MAG: substrate-binding domain-containing protein [Anaerolineales bacterium]|nr:substrate-binding domain-containing protein [Anaerolineales bacterium]